MKENDTFVQKDNANNKKAPGRPKSDVHKYYNVVNGKYQCNIGECKKEFSEKTSIPSLKDHITKCHREISNRQENNINNIEIVNNTVTMTQLEFEQKKICNGFAILFANKSLPHALIDEPDFRYVIGLLNDKFKITKKQLRTAISDIGRSINDDVLNILSVNEQPITIAIDGWTNVNSNKVTNILLISSGIAYYYSSIVNEHNSNNVEWLVPQLKDKINVLVERKLNIVAITADNENLMKATCKKIKETFPILNIVPCSAHLVQLCLKKICAVDKIKPIIDDTIKIIANIKSDKTKYLKLKNLQIEKGINSPLKLIYPIAVRWASLIDSIERLLKLKEFIKVIMSAISKEFWDNLDSLYLLIEPFRRSIDQIQKDSATLFSVWSNVNAIIEFYKSDKIPHMFSSTAGNIIELFKSKWSDHINDELIESARLFNLDKKFNFKQTTINFIREWGSLYLSTYNISSHGNSGKMREIFFLQLDEFISRLNGISCINAKNIALKRLCDSQNKQYSIKLVWNVYLPDYYELANVAIGILSICPSEACVERTFSAQANIHSPERNRLTNEIIEAEMNIKINRKKTQH